jgi:hypothetical protein
VSSSTGRTPNNTGGVRERLMVTRRGRGKTVCARGASGRPLNFTVRFHMKRVGLFLLLLWSFPALAKHCGDPGAKHWSTVVKLAAGPVTLDWTGVHEAGQAVCRLSYRNKQGQVQTLEVWGQPEPNETENLIAFAACTDDGCDKTVLVADIATGALLRGDLPVPAQQIFFSLGWGASRRTLLVETEGVDNQPPRHFTCEVTERVVCDTGGI